MKNNKGFSLIELMVVVAIIGILSAVGIPQYSKFQAKARQSEAKAALGALYTAEISFFTEWNSVSSDLGSIGFSVSGSNLRYSTGFNALCFPITPTPAPAERLVGTASQSHMALINIGTNPGAWLAATGITTNGGAVALNGTGAAPIACDGTIGIGTFTASSTGDPRQTPGPAIGAASDTWTINNLKLIANPIGGL